MVFTCHPDAMTQLLPLVLCLKVMLSTDTDVARKKLGHFNEIGSYYQKEKKMRLEAGGSISHCAYVTYSYRFHHAV